jgi:hypothetical protein
MNITDQSKYYRMGIFQSKVGADSYHRVCDVILVSEKGSEPDKDKIPVIAAAARIAYTQEGGYLITTNEPVPILPLRESEIPPIFNRDESGLIWWSVPALDRND